MQRLTSALLQVDEEISRVAKMYQEVRQTAEDNAPGTVLPPRGIVTSLLKKPDINRDDVAAPRGDRKPGDMLMEGLQDLAHFRRGVAGEHVEGGKRVSELTASFDSNININARSSPRTNTPPT